MKKRIALFLALMMCLSLCACGGGAGDGAGADAGEAAPKEEAKTPEFVLEHGIRFGMTLDEVSEKEPDEVDTSDGVLNGYLSGYVTPDKGDFTEYESYDDASEFYLFDPDTNELREVFVMLGDYGDAEASAARYADLLVSFTERYGAPTDLADDEHTYAYDHLVGNHESNLDIEGELLESAMWIVPDGDGSVKIELLGGMTFGDSYVTYIGFRACD